MSEDGLKFVINYARISSFSFLPCQVLDAAGKPTPKPAEDPHHHH
jgi:hypothetical protein